MRKFQGKFKICVPKNDQKMLPPDVQVSTPRVLLKKRSPAASYSRLPWGLDDPSKMSIKSCYKIMTA